MEQRRSRMANANMTMFKDVYRGRRVLVTGHTGFKGSWLTLWLLGLGAKVTGVSKDVPTVPSLFMETDLESRIEHVVADVRDTPLMHELVARIQPDFVFHLAAQAIVSLSHDDPVNTVTTNVVGTMNVLDALKLYEKPCVCVLVTSDKCYANREWVWGYRETDALGGKDVYSGSKGAAELVIRSYIQSFYQGKHPVRVGIGRAGNVIGGGDWAKDRLVADCMRAWNIGRRVEIRSPRATRPWQHVLEPLSGYLRLGEILTQNDTYHGEAFNFGPRAGQDRAVADLLARLGRHWGHVSDSEISQLATNVQFQEAALLRLNCDKALNELQWESNLEYDETVALVGNWYKAYYAGGTDMQTLTCSQIAAYESIGRERGRSWSSG